MNKPPADCYSDPAKKLLSVDEGRERILKSVDKITAAEQLPLRAALGRILSSAVVSNINVPSFDNSAMDGYALRSQDCSDAAGTRLEVCGSSFAGKPYTGLVKPGHCVRIMTGAVMPDDTDAVLMQEHVTRDGEQIHFGCTVTTGQNVRYIGEDTRRGEVVLESGTRLGAAEIGLLASVGISEVQVTRRLRVAFFSTGDELSGLGTPLEPGQIYDSNRYALFGMLSHPAIECLDMGVVADQRDAVRRAFEVAGEMADLVLTSGGVSVGEADFVTETLGEMGNINFWRMAMKPGKPLAFGRLGKAVFFGLPGNPVSTMVTYYQFVLPAIRKMTGETLRAPLLFQAHCSEHIKKVAGRAEFQRGVLQFQQDGGCTVSSTGTQGSHLLTSMTKANCLIHFSAESTGAKKGESVTVQPFQDFFN